MLLRTAGGVPLVSDGMRTLERVSPSSVWGLWASAAAGVLGLAYLLVVGASRSAAALRRGVWAREPLRWPALCLVLLVVAPGLYLTQSFLAIGDPTPANVAMALLTGALPVALVVAGVQRLRAGVRTTGARLDLVAIVGLLQWCGVLAAWGLVPLVMWR